MKPSIRTLFAAALLLPAGAAFGQHWGYQGEAGPPNWSKLDPKFTLCAIGRNQSPIDVDGLIEAELKPLGFAYRAGATGIVNNGHTVQVDFAPGSTLTVDGRAFELKQFHFHAPSENRIGGKSFPLEAHLVHADKEGNLAVVAVMFQAGAANAALARFWEKMPAKAEAKADLPPGLSAAALLPSSRDYYRFNGSLTTPPCSEGVRWLVMKQPVSASTAQIEQFSKTLGFANYRPLQPVYARPVLK
jgi:carbonic anhydrase